MCVCEEVLLIYGAAYLRLMYVDCLSMCEFVWEGHTSNMLQSCVCIGVFGCEGMGSLTTIVHNRAQPSHTFCGVPLW